MLRYHLINISVWKERLKVLNCEFKPCQIYKNPQTAGQKSKTMTSVSSMLTTAPCGCWSLYKTVHRLSSFFNPSVLIQCLNNGLNFDVKMFWMIQSSEQEVQTLHRNADINSHKPQKCSNSQNKWSRDIMDSPFKLNKGWLKETKGS